MFYSEDELLPISLLQHLLFCHRRAYLVYNEQKWSENVFTVAGSLYHENVEDYSVEYRRSLRIVQGLRIRSLQLGLVGITDVVEFHETNSSIGVPLPSATGYWQPFPVEYKSGHLRVEAGYQIQLCAQALCLEEMLNVNIPRGAIFYGKPRRRFEVVFSPALRNQTEQSSQCLHSLMRQNATPMASFEKKCRKCSLLDVCLPQIIGGTTSVASYYDRVLLEQGEYDNETDT